MPSLEYGLNMIAEQAKTTPAGQWVRVVGGWSPYQFAEQRMPTPAELTRAAPDTPVYVLFLYSQGFLNKAAVDMLGLTPGRAGAVLDHKPGRCRCSPDIRSVVLTRPAEDVHLLAVTLGGLRVPSPLLC